MTNKEFIKYLNCRYFPHKLKQFKGDELKNLFLLKLDGYKGNEIELYLLNGGYVKLEKQLADRVDEYEKFVPSVAFTKEEINIVTSLMSGFEDRLNETWGRPMSYIRQDREQ